MRVIAGSLGGRMFDSPRGYRTHPMSDKMRGGLFNVLGDITDLTLLDPFSGSGAVSFEAISRGARHALSIDNDKNAQKTIEENIKSLGLSGKVTLIKASASGWLSTRENDTLYDLIVCDPPYNNLQPNLIDRLSTLLAIRGTFILSWPGATEPLRLSNLRLLKQKSYGDAQLLFYSR